MALTGLEIYKLLPKTNCKKCGRPTCLAFAMQLAQKKASLSECPDVSEETMNVLGAASAPPIKLVTVGAGDKKLQVGEENVLFRHQEKFYHPCGVAVTLNDDLSDDAFQERLKKINSLKVARVGTEIEIDLIALTDKSNNAEQFAGAVKKVCDGTHLNIILSSTNVDSMRAALSHCAEKRPLLHGANKENCEAMAALAKEKNCPMTLTAPTLEELADLAECAKKSGVEEILLDVSGDNPKEELQKLTKIRRAALKKNFRALGFPAITFVREDDPYMEISLASTYLAKYAGIVVVNSDEPWGIMPLLTMRTNIFTDPQKPIQVEPKLYAVGDATEDSPVMFTTNFSLTYYTVEGEVESSRVPTYILSVDTGGTSVLTAYSGDKLNDKIVAKAVADTQLETKVKHRKLIIPGLVAAMSGKLQETLGWEILVGPREASGLPSYLKNEWRN
ncbi:MAG: acetyl-CoA decarbonylase/synthase complex subunit gamma [Candidatus Brocadiaceae bacterium]|nr:acetyl-CoA decarbonylase/synthase complex subunit gamma [Candidatus Brocadiaceae bacterium]